MSAAQEIKAVQLPLSDEVIASLRAGDELRLSGPVFTARDATHVRLLDYCEVHGELPSYLKGQALFYIGPTPARAGRVHGAAGPTTARRMDAATIKLAPYGIAATFGKGKRSSELAQACQDYKMLYFCGVGGAAALMAQHIASSEVVAFEELGTEALRKLELKDFPAFVALDTFGGDLYAEVLA
jgi:tartrate/fumarate subfamily iron-sulfur-dependent hydro-lyase beta chain